MASWRFSIAKAGNDEEIEESDSNGSVMNVDSHFQADVSGVDELFDFD